MIIDVNVDIINEIASSAAGGLSYWTPCGDRLKGSIGEIVPRPTKKAVCSACVVTAEAKKEKNNKRKKTGSSQHVGDRDVTAGLALKRLHLHMIRQSSRHKKPQDTREFWSSLMLSVTSLDAVWGGNWNLREKHRLHVMMDGVTVTAPVGFCQYLLGSLDVGFMVSSIFCFRSNLKPRESTFGCVSGTKGVIATPTQSLSHLQATVGG